MKFRPPNFNVYVYNFKASFEYPIPKYACMHVCAYGGERSLNFVFFCLFLFFFVETKVCLLRGRQPCVKQQISRSMHWAQPLFSDACVHEQGISRINKKKPYSCSILKYHNFHEGKWSFILSVRIEQLFLFLFPSFKKCVWLIVGIFILIHSLLRTFFNFLGILVFWLELVCKIKHFVVFIAANYRFHPKNTKLRSSTICLKQTENLSSFLWKKIIKIN